MTFQFCNIWEFVNSNERYENYQESLPVAPYWPETAFGEDSGEGS